LLSSPQQPTHDNSFFSFSSHPPPYTDRKSLILPHLANQVMFYLDLTIVCKLV
jgi:hypothetical protein